MDMNHKLNAQSSQVIQSYGSALSPYGLAFLGAHFVWAQTKGLII